MSFLVDKSIYAKTAKTEEPLSVQAFIFPMHLSAWIDTG